MSNEFFKTETGEVVTYTDIRRATEIIYGKEYAKETATNLESRIKLGIYKVKPLTIKQAYDYALNHGQKVRAIQCYKEMQEGKTGKYYSLIKAKEHVEKILERREKKNATIH